MVTSMIPSVSNVFVNKSIVDMRFISAYNPLINYDWSTTTAKEYKTDGVELVVNGGFDSSDTSNLIPNVATVSIVKENGAGRFISTEAWRYVEDASVVTYPFVVGKTYLYKFDVLETNASLRVGNSSELLVVTKAGSYEFAFTYQSGLARGLRISAYTTPVNALIDNISVQKVIQEPNKRYLKDVGITPTYNASMYFGIGAYLNGVDQTITVPINTTIQTALKRVNGIVTINETSQALTNYAISGVGVHKDYYLFTRLLTTAEKDSYTNTPEAFYAMAQADSTCVLNIPMCETSSTVRNYKTGIDHPITNYTTSVRDNAKNLRYGLQTCKFVRNSLGVIQSASNYLECNGIGYAIIPSHTNKVNIKMTVNPTSLNGNLLSGGVTKTLTGLTLNVDNDVVISNVTPTGAITLASGFSGIIKTYTEELV